MNEAQAFIDMIIPKIQGFTITGAVKDSTDEYWGFICKKGKQEKIVWVLCDPEGNGAGFLDVQENK